ncbi:MAG: aminoglycoside phosphotransferase family protein, partial [Kiritimatiellae bacterium]|nr:aminoglycoside phosphotransferase family protein [Kiritimatiellia bacterium]
ATAWPRLRDLRHAREVGRALGMFQSILADMPCDALADTLPGFHETPLYLREFDRVSAAPAARARAAGDADCLAMERFIESERPRAALLLDALARGDLRLRPIHGDPKVANMMIDDSTGLAAAVIDLDTSKPGLIHYDFGDCVRSACNPAGEEPEDPRSVRIDLDALREVAAGYLSQAAGSLSEADRALLYDSVRMIAFELGLRFFTDYLDGSRYFRVTYPGQNLRRATVQRLLCEDIVRKEGEIRRMLDGLWKQTWRRNS